MSITLENFGDAAGIKTIIDKLTAVKGKVNAGGARVQLTITNDIGDSIISDSNALKDAIGEENYNTIATTAFASINTSLDDLKTAKTALFNDL